MLFILHQPEKIPILADCLPKCAKESRDILRKASIFYEKPALYTPMKPQ